MEVKYCIKLGSFIASYVIDILNDNKIDILNDNKIDILNDNKIDILNDNKSVDLTMLI
jgi:hypothetical protein